MTDAEVNAEYAQYQRNSNTGLNRWVFAGQDFPDSEVVGGKVRWEARQLGRRQRSSPSHLVRILETRRPLLVDVTL